MVGTRQQFTKPVIVVFDNVAKEVSSGFSFLNNNYFDSSEVLGDLQSWKQTKK